MAIQSRSHSLINDELRALRSAYTIALFDQRGSDAAVPGCVLPTALGWSGLLAMNSSVFAALRAARLPGPDENMLSTSAALASSLPSSGPGRSMMPSGARLIAVLPASPPG